MLKSINFSRKDEINATSATPLQNAKNEVVTVLGGAITERPDDSTGEMVRVGLITTKEYGVMSTISKTAIRCLDLIIDYMTEEHPETVEIKIKAEKSNAGREFITLELQ